MNNLGEENYITEDWSNTPEGYTKPTPDENGWLHDDFYDKQPREGPDWYVNGPYKDIYNDFLTFRDEMYGDSDEKKRKAGGQFYTPPYLATKMFNMFGDSVPQPENFKDAESYKKAMGDVTKTILDPTAGAGSLLVPLLLSGYDPKLVHAMEADPNKIGLLRRRLMKLGVPSKNITMGDATNEADLRRAAAGINSKYLEEKKARLREEGANDIDWLLERSPLPNRIIRMAKQIHEEQGPEKAKAFIKDNMDNYMKSIAQSPEWRMSH